MNKLFSIVKPIITEKSTIAQEKGKYEFEVLRDADKTTIKRAFEELYGVKVISITTRILPKKSRFIKRGVLWDKRNAAKRAIVRVEKGKTIDPNKIK
ncbi:50S ribosomal protein L23 [Candidatus Peregrinibacteria bacterium]|jgi:large subunit ribosomal protein L23|nr:50S ribosomal protein L23 [Candidatus Peregrinibacteria bacterium]MBT4055668.1 50S ribosomal protein L23 [Candidatus Peregrinibacteria bacterium]